MKKKIITLAIASMFTLGISAFAQSPQNDNNCQNTENCLRDGRKCTKKDDKKCNRKDDRQCKEKKCVNPFEGLNLTEQQQAAIANIPSPRKVMKAARDQKSDATKSPEMRQAVARDIRVNYLNQVKAVLTPEQYVQFLENNFVNAQPGKDGKKPGKDGRHGDKRHHAKGHHGDKAGRNAKAQNS